MRAASASVLAASRTLAWMMANSSPPRRATRSPSRTQRQQALAGLDQQGIADRVPQRVVDRLEMIEVEAEHGKALAARQAQQRLLELIVKQRAVGKARQRVVARQMRDLLLLPAALGDVLVQRYPSPALQRLARHGDDALRAELDDHRRRSSGPPPARRPILPPAARSGARPSAPGAPTARSAPYPAARSSRGSVVHLRIRLVAHQQALLRIEHAQAERHIVDRGIELKIERARPRPSSAAARSTWP